MENFKIRGGYKSFFVLKQCIFVRYELMNVKSAFDFFITTIENLIYFYVCI